MAGVGFGPAWTGAYRIIVAETSPQQRTGLVAATFDVAYLFKSIPTHRRCRHPALRAARHRSRLDRADCLLVAPAAVSQRLHYRRPGQRGPSSARAEPTTPGPLHRPTRRPPAPQRSSSTPDMTTTQRAPSNGFEVKAPSAWVLKPET